MKVNEEIRACGTYVINLLLHGALIGTVKLSKDAY